MRPRVRPPQHVHERAQPLGSAGDALDGARLSQHPHLPEQQLARRIEPPSMQQKVGRLEILDAVIARIDAEIGEQAPVCRDAGQHAGGKATPPQDSDRAVRCLDKDAGVAVERRAHIRAAPHRRDQQPRDLGVRLLAILVVRVQTGQRLRGRIQPADPELGRRFRYEKEHSIGALQARHGLQRHLADAGDAGADDDEGAATTRMCAAPSAHRFLADFLTFFVAFLAAACWTWLLRSSSLS
jgi:hypothetical protein